MTELVHLPPLYRFCLLSDLSLREQYAQIAASSEALFNTFDAISSDGFFIPHGSEPIIPPSGFRCDPLTLREEWFAKSNDQFAFVVSSFAKGCRTPRDLLPLLSLVDGQPFDDPCWSVCWEDWLLPPEVVLDKSPYESCGFEPDVTLSCHRGAGGGHRVTFNFHDYLFIEDEDDAGKAAEEIASFLNESLLPACGLAGEFAAVATIPDRTPTLYFLRRESDEPARPHRLVVRCPNLLETVRLFDAVSSQLIPPQDRLPAVRVSFRNVADVELAVTSLNDCGRWTAHSLRHYHDNFDPFDRRLAEETGVLRLPLLKFEDTTLGASYGEDHLVFQCEVVHSENTSTLELLSERAPEEARGLAAKVGWSFQRLSDERAGADSRPRSMI